MSEERPPYNYQSDMGDTLRRAADTDDPVEFRQLLKLFASYVETEIDRSTGRAQTIIGNVEMRIGTQVSETHNMVRELGQYLRDQRTEQAGQYEAIQQFQQGTQVDLGNVVVAVEDVKKQQEALKERILFFQTEFHTLLETVSLFAERLTLLEQSSTRKEDQIRELRTLIEDLRQRTAADELTIDERREMIRTVRWVQQNMVAIAAALGIAPLERERSAA